MTTRKNSMSNSKTTETIDFRRRRLAAIFLVAFIIFAFSGIQLMKDYHRLGAFKQERADAIAESVAVDKKVKDLKRRCFVKDDDYVAKLARSRFLLSKEGEQIYPTPEQMKNTDFWSGRKQEQFRKNSQSQSSTETTKSSAE